jgi:zinc transport system permease protein
MIVAMILAGQPLALPLVACVAIGAFAPLIGTFLVQKRLSLIGDGIGHVAFAGVGAGLLLNVWPVWTALAFAVLGAVGVEVLRMRRKASGDLALALFFYTGLALGAVFASRAGDLDLEALPYLFGDPYTASAVGVAVILAMGVAVAAWVLLLRRVLFAVVTDEEWARVAGLPVDAVNIVLAGATAAVVVVGMKVVGILLIAALTVLPVASAQLLGRSFARTLRLACAIGAAAAAVGMLAGRSVNVAPGGAIVIVAAVVFTVVAVTKRTAPRSLVMGEAES